MNLMLQAVILGTIILILGMKALILFKNHLELSELRHQIKVNKLKSIGGLK